MVSISIAGNCVHCGAVVHSVGVWHGATPPDPTLSCTCREGFSHKNGLLFLSEPSNLMSVGSDFSLIIPTNHAGNA